MNVGNIATIYPLRTLMAGAALPMNIPVKITQTWLTVLLHGHAISQSPGTAEPHT